MARSEQDPLVASLLAAVSAAPADIPLRLHVAGLLLDRGRAAEALEHCSMVLRVEPTHGGALALLRRASGALASEPRMGGVARATDGATDGVTTGRAAGPDGSPPAPPDVDPPAFDWAAAEAQVRDIAELIDLGPDPLAAEGAADPLGENDVDALACDDLTLADVGGMVEVKERLERAFLAPMRNPGLAKAFGKNLSGGLLLYGPPGCGKTFLARAVAGELGARFYAVGLADVLDHWLGRSERNLRSVFATARRNAPCVLFLDEIDAIGQKRSRLRSDSAMRTVVNQLLHELDSMAERSEGVFVLGATNHPWDVDSALRRPGRFDRMLLVAPPDADARGAILRYHLRDRPAEALDLVRLARATDGYSGADLAHLAETATEHAFTDSLRLGHPRPIGMDDLEAALREVKPSIGPWLEAARSVALFGNNDGSYDDLVAYLKSRRMA